MTTGKPAEGCSRGTEPQREHHWLQRLVGEWRVEEKMLGPEQGSGSVQGLERVRSVGDLWIVAEGKGEMPGGGSATAVLTLGFDPQKKQFVGTFITSLLPYLWVYRTGELDAHGKVLTLTAEGPDMEQPGETATYRDVITLVSDRQRVMTSQILGKKGEWTPLMEAHYSRTG